MDDTFEMVIITAGNVSRKARHAKEYHGHDRPVDDMGSEADVSGGEFGTPIVCHGVSYGHGDDYDSDVNICRSPDNSCGVSRCMVCPCIVTVSSSDGIEITPNGAAEGETMAVFTGI